MIYISKRSIRKWSGPLVYREGERLFKTGRVAQVECNKDKVKGMLRYGAKSFRTEFRVLEDGTVENLCPCQDSQERGIICTHVVAVGIAQAARMNDPHKERDLRIRERMTENRRQGLPEEYIRRCAAEQSGAQPAKLLLELDADWRGQLRAGEVVVSAAVDAGKGPVPVDQIDRRRQLTFDEPDERLLYVLEDFVDGPCPDELQLNHALFSALLLELQPGEITSRSGPPLKIGRKRIHTELHVVLEEDTGRLRLSLDWRGVAGKAEVFCFGGEQEAWLLRGSTVSPLDGYLPHPDLHPVYEGSLTIERPDVPHTWERILPGLDNYITVRSEPEPVFYEIEPGSPQMELVLRGTPDHLNGEVYAVYGDTRFTAGKEDRKRLFVLPSEDDPFRYAGRNLQREAEALHEVAWFGFRGAEGDDLECIEGARAVMKFLARDAAALRRNGWRVVLHGRLKQTAENAEWVKPRVLVSEDAEPGWFELSISYHDSAGEEISELDIDAALLDDASFIETGDRTLLLDPDAIETLHDLIADCSTAEETDISVYRVGDIHAGYLMASLHAIEGIELDADPDWLKRVQRQNRETNLKPVELPQKAEKTLRSYQRDGVAWLRYLERGGFGGILADEMGLGKTIQALVWLQMERFSASARGLPALVVCPTSLVENWAEEAQRFTPDMRVCVISGPRRHELWDRVPQSDLVITSYALLRRDVDRLSRQRFAAAILDEAQHIKNQSTQNAKSAKKIRAEHRLVLTGTPIENGISDLWSIMDFLMPRYLGTRQQFRYSYEVPIASQGPEAEQAQERLRRKVHPFLLRRLKKDVIKDLPPKIERKAMCTMTDEQRRVYDRLLHDYRSLVFDMVSKRGFNQSRFEIFKTLLRLRQACCHLDLLKDHNIKAKEPSAKMALFLELIDEALDSGNRVLVFSQFVSMLQIIRRELDQRSIRYSYLDGSTKERLPLVKEFNSDESIPVFLISLKAGGTGLNLTGADMVIHFDPWWNPAVEDQATDRTHRIGQKRTVYNVKLITRDSVEEKVLEMQKRKKVVIDATIGTEEHVMQQLSWEDVQELLQL